MQKDKDNKEAQRVTRRSGTRMGSDPGFDRDRRRSSTYEDAYSSPSRNSSRSSRDPRGGRNDRNDRRYDSRYDSRYDDQRDDRYTNDEDEPFENHFSDGRGGDRYRDVRRETMPRAQRAPKSTKAPAAEQPRPSGGNPERTVHQLVPYALFCISVFAGVSFFLRDLAGLEGQTGAFGSFLADFLCGLLGVIAYALPVFMFVWALRWRSYVRKGLLLKKLLLSNAFMILLSAIVHVFRDAARGTLHTAAGDLYANGVARVGGGFFGGFVGEWIGYIFRLPGTIILAIPLLVIIAIYLVGMTPSGLWQRICCKYQAMKEKREERRAEMYDGTQQTERVAAAKAKPSKTQGPIAVTKWSEPRPLSPRGGVYTFSDEEDDPIDLKTPFARTRTEPTASPINAEPWNGVQEIAESEEDPFAPSQVASEPVQDPLAPTQPEPVQDPFAAAFASSEAVDDPFAPARPAASMPAQDPFAPVRPAASMPAQDPFAPVRPTASAPVEAPVAPAQPVTTAQTEKRAQEMFDDFQSPFARPRAAAPAAQPHANPQPAAQTYTTPQPAAQSYTTPQPAARPASTAPTAQSEQPVKRGQVYAPFALPVQPFPEERIAHSTPVQTEKAKEPTAAPAPVATAKDTDEILGAFDPARCPASSEAVRPAPAATPAFTASEPLSPFASSYAAPVKESAPTEAVEPLPFAQTAHKEPENVDSFAYFDKIKDVMEELSSAEEVKPAAPVSPFEATPLAEASPQKELPCDDVTDDGEEIADETEYFSPVQSAASGFAFDREHVPSAPAREPIEIHAERVQPQPVPPPSAASVPTYVPPQPTAPRVQVKAVPVSSEAPHVEPVIVEYKCPPIDLLEEDQNVRNDDFYEEIEQTKEILRQTMASFNIRIQDEINYSHGPSVTRYELRPVAGTSVRSVTNRAEDIALNLAAGDVRIEAPIPGKAAIGIEVPNKVSETVFMRAMLESDEFKKSNAPMEVPLGLDVGGCVRMCNLAKMPHLLVAGTTGSGKSVCINSMLVSLLYKTSPQDLRLILIDPKQVEFAPYENIPHLYMPIVTEMQRASGALACAVQEMERRFSLIRDVGARNIEGYNEAVKDDPEREHLPYILIVIDEFNDLKMGCNNNDPENYSVRLAQKARAAGIHLIIGTQRPSVDVITGKLKGNIPSRIAFMVKQQVDSRTILDVNGAEALRGRGDMLYVATNSTEKNPVRIQGAYVSDAELERVVSYVRRHNPPVQYNRAFMDQIEVEMARAAKADHKNDDFDFVDEEEGGEDPKFVEAVELALQVQKVATSLLQRRLGVGYGRAAKIIDRMEELGLVSPAEGNKPRKILPAAQGYLEHIGAMDAEEDEYGDEFDQ